MMKKIIKWTFGIAFLFPFLLIGFIYVQSVINKMPLPSQGADTLRDIFGVEFVIFLETEYLRLMDWYNRMTYTGETVVVDQKLLDSLDIDDGEGKPDANFKNASISMEPIVPKDISPIILKPLLKDEGKWFPIFHEDSRFYKSSIRSDTSRPWSLVTLCSIDIRRFNLHYVFGSDYRILKPSTKKWGKVKGTGRINPDHLNTIVASFNGGFQPLHDNGGSVINGKEIATMMKNKGCLVVFEDQSVIIINYNYDSISDLEEEYGKKIVYARQNQPMLIENGVINTTVKKWGITPQSIDPVFTWRSGLGQTKDGRLIFAAGNDLSAQTLAYSLKMAGAINAMHLDMNVSNVAFNFYERDENGTMKAFSLSPYMYKAMIGRYLQGYTHDYFYLTLKPATVQLTETLEITDLKKKDDLYQVEKKVKIRSTYRPFIGGQGYDPSYFKPAK